MKGLSKQAVQSVTSNGTAQPTKRTATVLEGMHQKSRGSNIHVVVPEGPQIKVSVIDCHQNLLTRAGEVQVAPDIYGFTPAMLQEFRGTTEGANFDIVAMLAKVIKRGGGGHTSSRGIYAHNW